MLATFIRLPDMVRVGTRLFSTGEALPDVVFWRERMFLLKSTSHDASTAVYIEARVLHATFDWMDRSTSDENEPRSPEVVDLIDDLTEPLRPAPVLAGQPRSRRGDFDD